MAEGEADGAFVMTRAKLRCFELFTRFDEESRARLLAIAEQMIAADGVVHPEELRFRDELHALLDAPQQPDDVEVQVALDEVRARVNHPAPARPPNLHHGHRSSTPRPVESPPPRHALGLGFHPLALRIGTIQLGVHTARLKLGVPQIQGSAHDRDQKPRADPGHANAPA